MVGGVIVSTSIYNRVMMIGPNDVPVDCCIDTGYSLFVAAVECHTVCVERETLN